MLGSKSQLEMLQKPFLMPVEDVFSITGRGTVATGRQGLLIQEIQLKSLVWELKN
jgi:translation elongation factor EF-Tu-like GTPase